MSSGSDVEKKVRLKCSDGEILEVEETVALESNMIKKKMEKAGHADVVIELGKVSSVDLWNVMDFCRKYVEARRENKEDEFKQLYIDLVLHWMNGDGDLRSDAKYLEIRSLVEFMDQQGFPLEREIMRSRDDQFIGPDEIEMSLDNDAKYLEIKSLVEFIGQQVEPVSAAKQKQKQQEEEEFEDESKYDEYDEEELSLVAEGPQYSESKYREIMRLWDDQPIGPDEIEMSLDKSDPGPPVNRLPRRSPVYSDPFQIDNEDSNKGLRHRSFRSIILPTVLAGSGGDHEQTGPLLADQNVGASANENLTHENVDEVSTNNTNDLEKMFVIINFVLELPSAVFDQLSSVHKLQYAIVSMSLSFVPMFLCIVELVHKCRKEKVTWEWRSILPWLYYPPRNHGKPFGSFKDIIGLICAICQCIFATITFTFALRHIDSPIKISFWPIVFALGLLFSKFLEKPGGRSQRIVGIP